MTARAYVPHLGWLESPRPDRVLDYLHQGWFEYVDQAFLWSFLRPGDVVVDCGAHLGLYSVLAGRITGGDGRIVAIEPNPELTPVVRSNLIAHGLEAATVLEVAVYSASEDVTLRTGGDDRAAYSSLYAQRETNGPDRVVTARTIDAILDEQGIERVDFLKLDIEGAEIDFLAGAEQSLAADRLPLVSVEFSEHVLNAAQRDTSQLAAAWRDRGYTMCRFDTDERSLVPAEFDGPIWYENLYAARDVDAVNQRLASTPALHAQIADDIVARGRQAAALNDERDRLSNEVQALTSRADAATAERDTLRADAERLQSVLAEHERIAEEFDRLRTEFTAQQAAHEADRATLGRYRQRVAELQHLVRTLSAQKALRFAAKLGLANLPDTAPALAPLDDAAAPSPTNAAPDLMLDALAHLSEKGFRPRVIHDIGAAKGGWAVAAAEYFPAATFDLFDPLPENRPHLEELYARDPRYRFHLVGLGEEPSTMTINVTEPSEGSSLLDYYEPNSDKQIQVSVERLDDMLRAGTAQAPEMMKIDVQGFELHTLRGAEKALESTVVLIIEVNMFKFMPECPRAHEVVGYLAERGFWLFDLAGTLRRPHENDLGQMDFVFVRGDSPLVADNRW